MPTKRPPASNHIRTIIAASCAVSGLAFMLGQGVAAYQANVLQPRLASLVSQIQPNEQMSIAHGETPTPTVHASKQWVAVTTSTAKRTSTATTLRNAALVTNTPMPTTDDAKDNQGQDKQDKQDKHDKQDSHDKANHDNQGNQGKHDGQAGNANSPNDSGQSDMTGTTDTSGQSSASGSADNVNFNVNDKAANPQG